MLPPPRRSAAARRGPRLATAVPLRRPGLRPGSARAPRTRSGTASRSAWRFRTCLSGGIENKHVIEFSLAAKCDLEGARIPLRILTRLWPWEYRDEGRGCAGPPVTRVNDTLTSSRAEGSVRKVPHGLHVARRHDLVRGHPPRQSDPRPCPWPGADPGGTGVDPPAPGVKFPQAEAKPKPEEASEPPLVATRQEPTQERTSRLDGAGLLRRSFALDVFARSRSGGRLEGGVESAAARATTCPSGSRRPTMTWMGRLERMGQVPVVNGEAMENSRRL
ncbi:hypothetical protein D7X74_28795 [Corallococcus sp. CA047B]|nr:hypothetical protein D7X74_28795 [Corallococcus sp. CA047B]